MAFRFPDGRPSDEPPSGPVGPMSLEAYLALLERTEGRHEYLNGMGYALAGAAHVHEADGTWPRETITDAGGGVVPLPCPDGAALTLDEIHEDLTLPTEPPRATRVFEQPETTTAGAS